MANVTVLCGRERRRRWTAAGKVRIVTASLATGLSVAEFARRHDVHPNLVHAWRRQARTGELSVAADGGARFVPVSVAAGSSVAGRTGDDAGVGSVVEVMLRNGRVLRLPEGVAPRRVALLADALEGCAR
jgi:transposase-like protein